MTANRYSVELKSLSDATCDVVFEITPPIKFVTEEAREAFGKNVLHLVCRRADERDNVLALGMVNVTHDSPDGSSTIGYAKIESLRYGSGKEIFIQALHMALHGEIGELYVGGKAVWEE